VRSLKPAGVPPARRKIPRATRAETVSVGQTAARQHRSRSTRPATGPNKPSTSLSHFSLSCRDWLLAMPITSFGFRLDDETIMVARACASGSCSANLMDAHAGPGRRRRSPRDILPPWPRPPPYTRDPERLVPSEFGPGRLFIYQTANRPLEDIKKTRRPNPHPLTWRKKPRLGCHCHGHSGRFLLARHLPNSQSDDREGVNPQSRKVQRFILDPPPQPARSGNPRPHQLRRPVLFLGAWTKAKGYYRRDARNCFPFSAHIYYHSEINAVAFRGTLAAQDTYELWLLGH